jgi:8-oxo-dGTP pyrophosphatase MutT (NUDIX family)
MGLQDWWKEKERILNTAMREVEEETGVNQLRITSKLQKPIMF